jgi:hypothetical protein
MGAFFNCRCTMISSLELKRIRTSLNIFALVNVPVNVPANNLKSGGLSFVD